MSVDSAFFLTFEEFSRALRAALSQIKETSKTKDVSLRDDARVRELKTLIEKGALSGRILDGFQERTEIQAELDYAAKLYTKYAPSETVEPALATFDPAALAAIKFRAPDLAELAEKDWIAKDQKPSAPAIAAYLEGLERDCNLRFDDGLVPELASQLANDPDGWALLAFTLKRLTRSSMAGNKIRRPSHQATVDCRSLLVEYARVLYNGILETGPKAERDSFAEIMARLGAQAQASDSRYATEASLLRGSGKEAAKVLATLRDEGVAVMRVVEKLPRWSLAHRSLPVRWDQLGEWVDARRAKDRGRVIRLSILAASLALVVGTLGFLQLQNHAMRGANYLAGESLVTLMKDRERNAAAPKIPDAAGPERRMWEALRLAVAAYDSRQTAITYGALFQVVNRIAAVQEGDSAAVERAPITIKFSRDARRIESIADGRVTMVPRPQRGNPVEVHFSPNRKFVGIVYDTPDKRSLEVYAWPNGNAIKSQPFECLEEYTPQSLRISASGQFYLYECGETGPESWVSPLGKIPAESAGATRLLMDKIYPMAKDDLLVFFDGGGKGDRYVLTGHPSGALRMYDLQTSEKQVEFVLPTLSAAIPRDVAVVRTAETSFQAAVLDRQGMVSLYSKERPIVNGLLAIGLPIWVKRLPEFYLFPQQEERAKAQINAVAPPGEVRWDAATVQFNDSGTCLSIRYAGQPQNPPRPDAEGRLTIEQHFRDEMFLLDADKLLGVASELLKRSKKVSRKASCGGGDSVGAAEAKTP